MRQQIKDKEHHFVSMFCTEAFSKYPHITQFHAFVIKNLNTEHRNSVIYVSRNFKFMITAICDPQIYSTSDR